MYIAIRLNDLKGIGRDNLRNLNLGKSIFGFLNLFPKIHGVFLLIFSKTVSEPDISSLFRCFLDIS